MVGYIWGSGRDYSGNKKAVRSEWDIGDRSISKHERLISKLKPKCGEVRLCWIVDADELSRLYDGHLYTGEKQGLRTNCIRVVDQAPTKQKYLPFLRWIKHPAPICVSLPSPDRKRGYGRDNRWPAISFASTNKSWIITITKVRLRWCILLTTTTSCSK